TNLRQQRRAELIGLGSPKIATLRRLVRDQVPRTRRKAMRVRATPVFLLMLRRKVAHSASILRCLNPSPTPPAPHLSTRSRLHRSPLLSVSLHIPRLLRLRFHRRRRFLWCGARCEPAFVVPYQPASHSVAAYGPAPGY